MQGQQVIVRTFGGKPVVGRLWRFTPRTVYVVSDENYEALSRGDEGLWPVGFPPGDVFKYDAEALSAIDITESAEWWVRLSPLSP